MKIQIKNEYDVYINGKPVALDCRTKDHAYTTACELQEAYAIAGIAAEILFA